MGFQFGNCPCGGGEYQQKEVDVTFTSRSLKLEGVVQGFCSACGARVYKLDTLWRIEAVMREERADPIASAED
jgi:YgiT-type zinc finger domain-containing protein